MAFPLWTWSCDQLKPTSGQQITLKKHFTSMSCTLEPAIQSGDIGQRMPFLTSVNWPQHNHISIRMSTIKLHTDCVCFGHLQVASNARSLQENNAWSLQENSWSECGYYCSHRLSYRAYSHDTTVAMILVFQNNEMVAILVFHSNPVGVGLFSYVKNFFCSHKFA